MQSSHFRRFAVLLLLATSAVLCGRTALAAVPQSPQSPAVTPKAAPAPTGDDTLSLADQLIQGVLEPLRTGLETQNLKQVLSIFDRNEAETADLQQQLQAFFRQYDQVRFRYQLLQATSDKDHATATAELDMDAMPYQESLIPARRSVQMRFRLKQEAKGWKIVGFTPADFFSLSNFSRTDVQ